MDDNNEGGRSQCAVGAGAAFEDDLPVRLLFGKSRISWYQNRPKDFSSSYFLSTMHNCEPLPVVQHQTVSS
jgi:hypothetical protein